jgi:ATP-dependent helicase HrpB
LGISVPSAPRAELPIDALLPAIRQSLAQYSNLVLEAPPGAGKTTRVPLALLGENWLASRRILMLEPRRLAARAAARFMAAGLGEQVGETVGYRVRLDSRVGPRTRIEILTDGLYLRHLQREADLPDIGAVLFDEVHERSLENDLALALTLETQQAFRPDLRLVAMSATLDASPLARLMRNAARLTSSGQAFPVALRWLGRPSPGTPIEAAVASAVRLALRESEGDLLVFLPGTREIRRTAERLSDLPSDTRVAPLYGDLDAALQDEAIRPSAVGRKVVLATAIAETSLTIEGVRTVIDSGLARVPRFEPASGMTRLETVRASRATAEQRRGRAGRTAPGVCYRLWEEAEHRALPPFPVPEIREADLASLALELALWGTGDASTLAWLDEPPAAALQRARDLLRALEAIDAGGAVTSHGRAMAAMGTHPRLAHMMLAGARLGATKTAADLAALLDERDIWRGTHDRGIDIRPRLVALRGGGNGGGRVLRVAEQFRRRLDVGSGPAEPETAGRLLALAYPERIAQRRGRASFRLANGRGARCDPADPLANAPFLAIADLDGEREDARIFRAAPLAREDIEQQFGARIVEEDTVEWDGREQAVIARRRRRLDALVLANAPLSRPDDAVVTAAVLSGIRSLGLSALPWDGEAATLRARIALLRRLDGPESTWPDVSDAKLLETMEIWLVPFLGRITRRAQFSGIPLAKALASLLDWRQAQRLDREAPREIALPSGRRARIDYISAEEPVLAVRIQEMFGATATPAIAGGRVPLLLHLLSPAQRPIQVTRDLAGFWTSGYAEVRSELRGRYPRHFWPEDPRTAAPTSRVRPR